MPQDTSTPKNLCSSLSHSSFKQYTTVYEAKVEKLHKFMISHYCYKCKAKDYRKSTSMLQVLSTVQIFSTSTNTGNMSSFMAIIRKIMTQFIH